MEMIIQQVRGRDPRFYQLVFVELGGKVRSRLGSVFLLGNRRGQFWPYSHDSR